MPRVVILIPPSESKIPSGAGKPLGKLDKDAQVIYKRLMAYSGDAAQLYGVKGKALEAARQANADLLTSPTIPAILRYNGVVFEGIDHPSLSAKAGRFFDAHVRIVSALFGLVSPDQPIPDHKLKIEKLNAAAYWKPLLTAQVSGCYVIDLLPQAYQKAVSYEHGIRVDFIISKKGKNMPAGHQGKLIKGRFIRWLCENAVTDPQDFTGFQEDGFRYDGHQFIRAL